MNKPSVNMYIPDTIKGYLVDDWEYVTKNYQLVPLPAENPVNWIMDEYFNQEKNNRRLGSPEAQLLEEVRVGIKEWFKRALGKTLLYKFEREQYSDVSVWWETAKDSSDKWYGRGVGDCYGAEHLLRLLGKQDFFLVLSSPERECAFPVASNTSMPCSQNTRIHCTHKHGCSIDQYNAPRA